MFYSKVYYIYRFLRSAQLVGLTLSDLLDQPRGHGQGVFPSPQYVLSFLSHLGYSFPTFQLVTMLADLFDVPQRHVSG